MPGRSFRIAGVVALSGIVAAMLTLSREPPAVSATASPAVVKAEFDARWDDAAEPAPLKKQDRLALPVTTERVPVPPRIELSVDDATAQIEAKKPVEKTKRHVREHNICTRHKMHKVMIRGGRSWRCRR